MRTFRMRKGRLYMGNDREIGCWRSMGHVGGSGASAKCLVDCAAFRRVTRDSGNGIEHRVCCLALPPEADGGPAILGVLDEQV